MAAHPDAATGRVLDADWSLFTRVTDNLMENALQYTRGGDRIRLAALQHNGQVEVAVQDSGPGISADQLAHIFDPFFRGAAERPEPGSGLGLAVARSIVEAHGWADQCRRRQWRRSMLYDRYPEPNG